MIICFEGPSAIGKTKLSESLSDQFNIVPEVNLLFERDETATKLWYYEKQVERYKLCKESRQSSILDGDIFQPLWYNWTYGYHSDFPSRQETIDFYFQMIKEGQIQFPDLYILFQADEDELRQRKEADGSRTRRNFEKHLKLIEPQQKYFRFLAEETDVDVGFVHYTDFTATEKVVTSLIQSKSEHSKNDLDIFESAVNWLK
ncbi:MAG: hypothetical protein RLN81_15960 [Balneolaceae bacterium]